MILATVAGLALQHWGGVENAPVFGLLVGFVLARLVPAPGSCALPPRSPSGQD